MKRIIAGASFAFLLICSCTYSKFVLTGKKHDPLSEDKPVKVIPWGNQADYDVIGMAEIGESDIESRINEAKRIARENGGDVVAPKGIESGDASQEGDVGYRLHSFMILKSRQVSEVAKAVEPAGVPLTSPGNYPKASFKLLRDDYESLKGQKFQGALYPYKFKEIPSKLLGITEGYKKLVEMRTRTRSPKFRIYLLIPTDNVSEFEDSLNSKEVVKFVYTPVSVYKRKIPVLEFISILE